MRLSPARTIPPTRWRNEGSRWRTTPKTFFVLILGLWLFGTGEAMLVNAGLGVSPWTVLAEGISLTTGASIGWATFVVSLSVLALWLPLRERPGLGTVSNAIVIAFALGTGTLWLPSPTGVAAQILLTLAGVATVGIGSGLYLTTNLGPGPRDGLMTGIHQRTGRPVAVVRLMIELLVLLAGWLLGGTVGIGTAIFALGIGPAVGWGLALAGRLGRPVTPA